MRWMLTLTLLLAATACGSGRPRSTPAAEPSAGSGPAAYTGLRLESLPGYHATFELDFKGASSWRYRVETRTDGHAVEYRLTLEGLDTTRDPGDVRVVAQDGVTRMHGPGTDEQCVQYPSDLDLGPTFLTPDHLVDPPALGGPLKLLQRETIAGVETSQYTVRQASLDRWRDLIVNLWRDESSGATLRYELLMVGPDPLFDAGQGVLAGRFVVNAVGTQAIEPVAGCEIDLPLPGDAARVVRLPGLVAFDSAATAGEAALFYQTALPGIGWEPVALPQMSGDAIVLSYQRAEQTLEINIEMGGAGVHVELLLGER